MWDLIVSVPDHCLSFYFSFMICLNMSRCMSKSTSDMCTQHREDSGQHMQSRRLKSA